MIAMRGVVGRIGAYGVGVVGGLEGKRGNYLEVVMGVGGRKF